MNVLEVCKKIDDRKLFINLNSQIEFLEKVEAIYKNPKSRPTSFFYIYLGSIFYAFKDKRFLNSLMSADFIYLDGFFIGWIIELLYKKKVAAFPPDYYFNDLMRLSDKYQQRVTLLGGKTRTVKKALKNLESQFPQLEVSGIQGYSRDNKMTIKMINSFRTDLLIVGLGLNNQEKWIADNEKNLKRIKIILSVGNYINVLGEQNKLPPDFITNIKLRWLYRLASDPFRLGPRYFFGFVLLIFISFYSISINLSKKAVSS